MICFRFTVTGNFSDVSGDIESQKLLIIVEMKSGVLRTKNAMRSLTCQRCIFWGSALPPTRIYRGRPRIRVWHPSPKRPRFGCHRSHDAAENEVAIIRLRKTEQTSEREHSLPIQELNILKK